MVIYIDDLDRAWEGTTNNIKRIAALLNAVRDLTNAYPCLHFRISLRSDVYFLVRTADESTDKIEGNVIWLSWTEHELLVFLAKRVQSYLGNKLSENALIKKPQFEIAKELYPIMESHFMGEGKWNNIFVVTRYREMSAGNALPVRLVLIRPGCAEEFWPAAAIPRFTEGI